MNRFLKYVFFFSCIIAACLVIGEIICRHIPSSYSYKADWLRKNAGKVNTLVLGSSHTYYGIKPDVLGDSVFNLANISQTPEYDLALLKEYLPQLKALKRVLIPISYFTFRDPLLEDMSPGLCVNYKVRMRLPIHSDFSRYNFTITDFPAFAGRLRSLVQKQEQNTCDSLGFGLGFDLDHRSPGWEKGGKERATDLTQDTPGRPEQVRETLTKIIELCSRNNIECIFVTTPVWKTFRINTDPAQLSEMRSITSDIVNRYNIRYFDYFDNDSFSEDDFHDCDHLSDKGALRMSTILRYDLSRSDSHAHARAMQ